MKKKASKKVKPEAVACCLLCAFADNGVSYCHRYPLKSKVTISHWCGEFKETKHGR